MLILTFVLPISIGSRFSEKCFVRVWYLSIISSFVSYHKFDIFPSRELFNNLKRSFSKSSLVFFVKSVFMFMKGFNFSYWLNSIILCIFLVTVLNLWPDLGLLCVGLLCFSCHAYHRKVSRISSILIFSGRNVMTNINLKDASFIAMINIVLYKFSSFPTLLVHIDC